MANKEKKTGASNYSATIREASFEMSAKERVMFKDTQNAVSLMDLAQSAKEEGGKAIIDSIKGYVILDIHNDKSDDVDYMNFVLVDSEGQKYVTGSESFVNAFMNIYAEMKDETESWGIQLNLIESKNYKGKYTLTCSLV